MKKHIGSVITLFVICLVTTALVACANSLTKDTIASNESEAANATMRLLISDAADFIAIEAEANEAYEAKDASGNIIGYIFVTSSDKGYGGEMTVMTALDTKGIVMGLEITADEETQGLGKNAHNESFRKQFIGRAVEMFTVKKGEPSQDGEIKALTGATKSSEAVTDAVNKAIAALKGYKEGN